MNRRHFLFVTVPTCWPCLALAANEAKSGREPIHRLLDWNPIALECRCPRDAAAANKKFVFKIKTKSGSIVGNIVIEAKDAENAKYKLRQRYPECEIMEMKEK